MTWFRMNRKEKLLYHVRKSGVGIEIGPSFRPTAAKRDGFQVHVMDHANREQLVEKYQALDIAVQDIEEVDFVWRGEPYAELTGKTRFYDWIIASHLIEHTPDLISFFNDCDSILKDDGVLSLAIPDKRYCFDHFRPLTGISKIIDAHFPHRKTHSLGTAVEQNLYAVSKGEKGCWRQTAVGKYRFSSSVKAACEQMECVTDEAARLKSVANRGDYLDCHAWCFSPHSFRLILHDLYLLGLTSLREISYFPTHGCEFFVTLGRQGVGLKLDRLEMLKLIDRSESSWGGALRNLFTLRR
jgi:2-polyprenyl-3-methyl-5-hydroxy-6-metoxy-1,4-benzoquinol methylase